MSTIQEFYSVSVSQLPVSEKLQLAALILNDVAPLEPIPNLASPYGRC